LLGSTGRDHNCCSREDFRLLYSQQQKEKARGIHACAHFGGRFEEDIVRMQILIAFVKQPEILRPVLL
jgi:hypothetical protein